MRARLLPGLLAPRCAAACLPPSTRARIAPRQAGGPAPARLPPQRARLSSPDCGDGRARAGGDAGVARALEQRGGAHPLPTPRAWVPPSGGDRERELTRQYHYKLLVLLAFSQATHLPAAQTHETKPWTRSA